MTRLVPAALALVLLAVSACGYALAGRANNVPLNVKRIGVPPFENQSTTPDLDRVLADAVRTELQSRGRWVIVQDATGVDAVLTAVLRPIRVNVLALTDQTRQASKYSMTVDASVEFKDLTVSPVKVLWTNPAMRVAEEYEATGTININDPGAIFSQDENALSRLAKAFARSVVSAALEGS
jgi:outer membrane lipopolysaccharide assembly protein LptE/RlpB